MNTEEHMTDTDIAAWLDKELDSETRATIEGHLAICDECRSLAMSVSDLLQGADPQRTEVEVQSSRRRTRPRRWRFVAVGAGLADAAAVVILMLPSGPGIRPPQPDGRTRDAGQVSESLGRVEAITPLEGVVPGNALRFVWKSSGADATYDLTVSDSAGAIVWTSRTIDTMMSLPDSVAARLAAGATYFWQVDALLPDLRSASTGPRLLIRPAR